MKKFFSRLSFVTAIALSFQAVANIQETPLSRPNIMAFEYQSATLAESLRIEVALPLSYAFTGPETNYPVAYVGDGNQNFLLAANQHTLAATGSTLPHMLTVGVDFSAYANGCLRSQWYTPTQVSDDENCGEIGGGAEIYLDFIEYELKPLINSLFRTDQTKEFFLGHSHTATLGLYSVFKRKEIFDAYVLSSPSLYWDNEVMYQLQEEFIGSDTHPKTPLFFSVGLNEAAGASDDPITQENLNKFVFSYVARMAMKMKQDFPDHRIGFRAYPNESHGSVVSKAFHDGLDYVVKGVN